MKSNKVTAELISFGNELLIGKIVNTNASFLGKRLTEFGIHVTRITALPDEFEALSHGFLEAISRSPDLIISTGGLGPTWDDRTAEGLSIALKVPLRRDETALKMIEERYEKLKVFLSPASLKMADFPLGAKPLRNSVGTAPGICTLVPTPEKETRIYCLPGVPSEMKAILEEVVLPDVVSSIKLEQFFQVEFSITGIGESKFAHVTGNLVKEFPDVYIKSHPSYPNINFHLTTFRDEKILKLVKERLQKEILSLGARIVP
ncbi:MAG TPA: molybdopterin-binding protein, partial [Candidatus Hodarchaeales archaeon]|nr:molybdopterin-binding protein [Candidatus Hodarchaeales archaeon]